MLTLLRKSALVCASLFCVLAASFSHAADRRLVIDGSAISGKTVSVQVGDVITLCLRDDVSPNKVWSLFGWKGTAIDLAEQGNSASFISACPTGSNHAANFRAREVGNGIVYIRYLNDAVPPDQLKVEVGAHN